MATHAFNILGGKLFLALLLAFMLFQATGELSGVPRNSRFSCSA